MIIIFHHSTEHYIPCTVLLWSSNEITLLDHPDHLASLKTVVENKYFISVCIWQYKGLNASPRSTISISKISADTRELWNCDWEKPRDTPCLGGKKSQSQNSDSMLSLGNYRPGYGGGESFWVIKKRINQEICSLIPQRWCRDHFCYLDRIRLRMVNLKMKGKLGEIS